MILSFAPIALLIFLLFSAVQLFGADASYAQIRSHYSSRRPALALWACPED